jgi:hypothetical protein
LIILTVKGIYNPNGEILIDSMKSLNWKDFTEKNPPNLPVGTSVDVSISIDENDFISGKYGIVWATYNLRQAEVVVDTLLAQNINCEIETVNLEPEPELKSMFLISVTNESDTYTAVDFVWKNSSGLRLKPDWTYPQGETNNSFEQWLNGQ